VALARFRALPVGFCIWGGVGIVPVCMYYHTFDGEGEGTCVVFIIIIVEIRIWSEER